MATKAITDESFETDVIKSNKPTIVDFWADWCGPCKQIGPVLEEISNEMKDEVIIAKHNIDENLTHPLSTELKAYPLCCYLKVVSSKLRK
jgi:thioredoxin 1